MRVPLARYTPSTCYAYATGPNPRRGIGLALADYQRLDRAMAIRQAVYDYLLPSFEGEALTLGTWLEAGDGRVTLVRRFQLRRDRDGATLLRGRWELVCIDVSGGRPRRMPEAFLQAYGSADAAR